uniref:Uncharacterized protein n=1 Tax=Anopheles culicifacies TaxID=139723 RepID=A0A182MX09_9DIPT
MQSVQVQQQQGRAAATSAARRPRSLTAPSRRLARYHRKEEIVISSRRPTGAAVVVARDPRSIHRRRRHFGVIWPHRQPKEKSEWVPAISFGTFTELTQTSCVSSPIAIAVGLMFYGLSVAISATLTDADIGFPEFIIHFVSRKTGIKNGGSD